MTNYLPISGLSSPYGSCWDWGKCSGYPHGDILPCKGTAFAARASSWKPVTKNDQDLRCLPDPVPASWYVGPAETQVWNQAPPCPSASCNCGTCVNGYLTMLNGWADVRNVTNLNNPLLYPPKINNLVYL